MKYFTYRGKRHYIKFEEDEDSHLNPDGSMVYTYECGDFIIHANESYMCRRYTEMVPIKTALMESEEKIKSCYWELVEDRIGYKCIAVKINDVNVNFDYIPVLCKVRIPKGALVYDGPFDSKKRATEAYIEKIYSIEETFNIMKREFDATDFIRPKHSYMGIRAIQHLRMLFDTCDILSDEYLKCADKVCPEYYSIYEVTNPPRYIEGGFTMYKEGMHIDLTNEFDFEPKQCAAGFHYFGSDLHAAAYMTRVLTK